MRVIYSLRDAQLTEDSVVTIGAFDGIHRGHRTILDGVRQAALDQERASAVVTFFPHPGIVLGRADPFYLTSTEEKIVLLNAFGIDLLVIMPFTLEMSRMRAADYVSILIDHLRMREMHVGRDFALGHQREGNIDFLTRLGREQGFVVRVIDPLVNGGTPISSSGIRGLLRAGDVAQAAAWLGHPFRLSGTVVQGDGRGRAIGVPTANLEVWQEHAVPANGVYACWAWVGNLKFRAAVNIGVRPTFTDKAVRAVEAHVLDFDRDIYGVNVALDFVMRLRDEHRFPNFETLVAQIRMDIVKTREVLVDP